MKRMMISVLCPICLLFASCAPLHVKEPMGLEEKGGQEYEVTEHTFLWVVKWKEFSLSVSGWEQMLDTLDTISTWFLWVGAAGAVACLIVGLVCAHYRFATKLAWIASLGFVVVFAAGMLLAAVSNWAIWILFGLLVLAGAYIWHRYREKDVIEGGKKAVKSVQQKGHNLLNDIKSTPQK